MVDDENYFWNLILFFIGHVIKNFTCTVLV